MDPYRNLLIHGINALVELKKIPLAPTGKSNHEPKEFGHVFVDIAGQPSVVSWNDAGFDELRISVWWKYDHSRHPQANLEGNYREQFHTPSPLAKSQHLPKFVGVTVSAWFEREEGPHLQGHGRKRLFDIYTRKGELEALKQLPTATPLGYRPEGKFYL